MKTVQIEVTAQDIMDGEPVTSARCPVAHAINRVLQAGSRASVSPFDAMVIEGGYLVTDRITLPPEARLFINRFDQREKVEPFFFALDMLEEVLL